MPHIKSLGTRLVSEYRSLTLLFLVPYNTEEEEAPLWCSVVYSVMELINVCIFLVFRLQAFDGREGGVTNESIGKKNFVEIGCLYAINQSKYITVL